MGTTISNDTNEDTPNNFRVEVDLDRGVSPELKQLINWSLQEIRDIYSAFRRRKSSPILNRTEFARLVNLSRTSAFYLFPLVSQKAPLTVFVVIAMMILTSYSNLNYKINFLFLVFDFSGKGSLRLTEMKLMYRSLVRAYCLITYQPCPKNECLDKYSRLLYTKSDLNDNQGFEIKEVLDMIENNSHAMQLFTRFESPSKIKEEYHIFNKFSPYSEKEAHFINKLALEVYEKTNALESFLDSGNWSKVRNQSLALSCLEELKENSVSPQHKTYSISKTALVNKVIIIKGKSITRKEIFKLKDYFDNLANGSKHISLQEFIEAFSGDKFDHMRSITASLFNFLDRKQSGKVTFADLLFKIYPSLSLKQFEIIQAWISQYDKMFTSEKRRLNEKNEEVKKRLLPKNCILRLKEIFKLFDREKKGWVSLDNLKEMFKESFTEKEIVEMFSKKDLDKDNKLNLEEFIRILLPNDVDIEGFNHTLPPIRPPLSPLQS